MNISTDVAWKSFMRNLAGTGSISVSGDKLTVSNTTVGSGNYAFNKKAVFVKAGETYTFSCMARRISGANGTSGSISIYYPTLTDNVNKVEINTPDWERYELRYTIPFSAQPTSTIQINIGILGGCAGEFEISNPLLTVENTPFGALRSIGHALFQWNGSSSKDLVTLPNWSMFNIGSKSYVQADKALYVQVEVVANSGLNARPLFFANMTPDGDPQAIRCVPKVGSYNITTGMVKIQFLDVTTGDFIDINNFNVLFFLMGVI